MNNEIVLVSMFFIEIKNYNIDEYYIKSCDLKWKEYAKDMIIDERKEKCDLFKSIYNSNVTHHSSPFNDELFYLEDLFFFHHVM